jgi:regulator of RNase E activity RraA
MKVSGFAATIEFVPSSDYDPNDPYGDAINYLDSLKKGEVAVVATGRSQESAFWGELFSTAAKNNGADGVICDGPLRDVNQILETGFKAFGHSSLPFDYKARMRVKSVRGSVLCGGVQVNPGDYVIGDIDGVVVVPAEVIPEVFKAANERASGENKVLKDLKKGMSVRAAWDKHHIL